MPKDISSLARRLAPVALTLGALLAGLTRGFGFALLVLAGGALLLLIALVWGSVQSLTGEAELSLDEALGLGAPTAQEEQKRAVLRALKDLEYERGVGKVSEEDYAELKARYRAEAKRLLESVDEGLEPARARAEQLLAARLRASAERPEAATAAPSADPTAPHERGAGRPCASCATPNDADALFCKKCGARLELG